MTKITHRSTQTTVDVESPPTASLSEKSRDFYWTNNKEPHVVRRKEILAKYPEINKLCGHEPKTKYIVACVVATQFAMAYCLRNQSFWSLKFWSIAYLIGATCNQNIFLAIHETSHNLLFKKPLHNKLFAIFINLPVGIPYSASFQPYHQLHHKFLGDDKFDADLPTTLEAVFLSNVLGKAFFATFQILFYALRPMFVTQIQFTFTHLLNIIIQVGMDILMCKYWGGKALGYFILSSFLAGSLHPCAGHFIAEHYVLGKNTRNPSSVATRDNKTEIPPAETYSYYGPLNYLTWNVGLHNEHHDFPYIAWSKLPKITQIAKEFYEPLPKYESWIMVIVDFIFNGENTLYNRVRREKTRKFVDKSKLDVN